MTTSIDRIIPLEGSANFRDIGGYTGLQGRTVRWGRLFRSDGLSSLTARDLATLQPVGIRSILDLRAQFELDASGPSQLIAAQGSQHHHVPFIADNQFPKDITDLPPTHEMYAGMLERGLPAVKTIFDLLANETAYPVVVHCAGGRDRTGVTIALLLRTLGVDDATIAADYALTDLAMPRMIERMKTGPWGDRIKTLNAADLTTRAESMIEFLQIVDTRFGGTTQVLYESGVPAETGERLRELLLERPAV